MDRRVAFELAVNALQKEYRYFLYASDSDWANKKRIEISKAIDLITEEMAKWILMKRQ